MNNDIIGSFIKKLREKNNMTQEELADKLFVTRQSVSKWENGLSVPSTESFKILSNIFNVSIDELLLGDYLSKDNEHLKDELKYKMIDETINEKNKNKKLKIFAIILLILSITIALFFLLYYFSINFNSVKIYTLYGKNDDLEIVNGVVIDTNEKHFFYIGDIVGIDKSNISYMDVYYIDDNKKKNIYFSNFYDSHFVIEDNEYNEYISNNVNKVIDKLYVNIKYEDKEDTIKMNYKLKYANNKILLDKGISISPPNITTVKVLENNITLDKKLMKIFKDKNVIETFEKEHKYIIEYYYNTKEVRIDKFDNNGYIVFMGNYNLSDDTFYEETMDLEFINCKKNIKKCNKNLEKELEYLFNIIDKEARN